MGAQRHNVPHFKGLIMLYLDFEAQGRDSTFAFCQALLKKAILEGKRATVRFDLNTAVHSYFCDQLTSGIENGII